MKTITKECQITEHEDGKEINQYNKTENFVYRKFNELIKDEQDKVVEKYYDIAFDDFIFDDMIINSISEIKDKTGFEFEEKEITMAVGDRDSHFGVFGNALVKKLLEKYEEYGVYDIEVPEKVGQGLHHRGGGICSPIHTQKSRADIYFEDDMSENKQNEIREKIDADINDVIDVCRDLHNRNEEQYQYQLSREAIVDMIEANDYYFDENLNIAG